MSHSHAPGSVSPFGLILSADNRRRAFRQCLLALAATLAAANVTASEIDKANNADNLNLTTSWTGGIVPGSGDVATWNNLVTGPNAPSLGTNATWLGIKILDPGGAVLINADGNTLTNGSVNAAGNVGIDMSNATQDLTLSNNVVLNGVQNWKIASGRTLRIGGNLIRNSGGVIRFNLADTTSLVIITNGSDVITTTATPNAMLGGLSGFGNNYFGTVNDVDFAALTDAPGGGLQVIPGSGTGLYTANGSGNTDPGNANVLDMITDDPAAFGQRASNGRTWSGFRFNIPQANSLQTFNGMNAWQINIPSGRTVTCNAILITTNVGNSVVLIDNGGQSGGTVGNFRIGSGGGQNLLVYQNNPAAPLVVQPNVNITQQGSGSLVKMGAGTMIIQSPATGYTNGTRIYEGTLLIDGTGSAGVGALNVVGGNFAQSSGTVNPAPTTFFSGATNSVNINASGASSIDNSNITFNAGSRLQLVYSNGLSPSATVAALFITNVNNGLVASNSVTVDVVCGSLALGQFPLVKYSGAIGGSGGGAFTLGLLEPHSSGYISNNVGNSSIDLVVTNITQPLKWSIGNGAWDKVTTNWNDTLNAPTTYQEIGSLGDAVVFDDSASGASPVNVTLDSTVIPSAVTVAGSSKDYVISGAGGIAGFGSVIKSGSGKLTLSTTNFFVGGLRLNSGVLTFSSLTNLGLGGISFGGGTLRYASGNLDDISVRTVTFGAGGGTIDDGGNLLNFAHPIGNNGAGGLIKMGAGTLTLNGTNTYSGNTVVAQGTLALGVSTLIGNSAAIVVNGGAVLDTVTSGVGLTLNGTAHQILAGIGTVNGEITAPANTTISPATNGVAGTLAFGNDLTVNGGTLVLDISPSTRDLISIAGGLTLSSGTVQLNVGGTLANGTYKLIQFATGLFSGPGSSGNLVLAGFSQAGQTAFLIDTPTEIDLFVGPAASDNITWGTGASWDLAGTPDWFNGATPWSFTNGDAVTFDDTGSPTVNLETSLRPGSVTVSNNTVTYTFADGTGAGGGKLSGSTGLAKNGSGTLFIQTANNNTGPTVINGGIVQVGNGGIGDIGSGNITNNGALIFGQGDNAAHEVPGLITGSGSVTQNGAATTILDQNNTFSGPTTITTGTIQVGNGGATGSLGSNLAVTNNGALMWDRSGSLALANNITGSGSLANIGSAALSFTGTLTYQGNTTISNGTVKLTASNQIPDADSVPGSTGLLGVAGTFDLAGFNETVNGLTGLGASTGHITNSAASGTNVLRIGTSSVGAGTNTYLGSIVEKTNAAHISVVILGPGNQTLANTNNNYSAGTFVGNGATLTLGTAGSSGVPGNVAAGTGTITMSNNTTLFMNGNVQTFPVNPLTIAPFSSVNFNSQALGDTYSGLISGDATGTNVIAGLWSSVGSGYNGFFGTVLVPTGGQLRFLTTPCGGSNTTFDIEGTGQIFARTTETIVFGKLTGTGSAGIDSGGVAVAGGITGGSPGTYIIGTANQDSTYGGTISGQNNITKAGTGTLTLNGSTNFFTESIDPNSGLIITNYLMTNGLYYVGATTVSNGVLAIVAPANLNGTNFTSFTLASSSAVLDLSSMGSTPDGVTLVTNSTLTLAAGQTLSGLGTVKGHVMSLAGSIVSVALAPDTNGSPVTGQLNINNGIELAGAININVSTTNTPNSGEIVSSAITIDPSATLTVTNLGPEAGATFHLFSKPVSGFASITLPTLTGTNSWITNLTVDGSITLVAPPFVNTTPTNIIFSASSGNLTLSWPADHLGWTLQAQTNPPGVGIGSNWVNIPGSASFDQITGPLNPTNGSVFFRLTYP